MSERRYGKLRGGQRGTKAEDPTRCIVEIWPSTVWVSSYQCSRPRGHGPGGLYCKQHAKMKEGEK